MPGFYFLYTDSSRSWRICRCNQENKFIRYIEGLIFYTKWIDLLDTKNDNVTRPSISIKEIKFHPMTLYLIPVPIYSTNIQAFHSLGLAWMKFTCLKIIFFPCSSTESRYEFIEGTDSAFYYIHIYLIYLWGNTNLQLCIAGEGIISSRTRVPNSLANSAWHVCRLK